MGNLQAEFLETFKHSFSSKFGSTTRWISGQTRVNSASLLPLPDLRRSGQGRGNESIELGDMRTQVEGYTLIIEYDGGGISTHNLLKYWPYVRGDMNSRPGQPIILCHFSDWSSYGTYRDLWQWLLPQMQHDPRRIVDFTGQQFDHFGTDIEARGRTINLAVDWIASQLHSSH